MGDTPVRLEARLDEHLSPGLWLVKWLLAIPHYVVVAFFVGGETQGSHWNAGLILVLAVVAGVVLLFTGRYPTAVFDLVVGLQRWVFRVTAYAALMTDAYPPFRLDQGGEEPLARSPG